MIYITGDTHADFSKFDETNFPLQNEMTKNDYIITHCCPINVQPLISLRYKKDYLTDYLQTIAEKCEFKRWYFGHYHDNKHINSQYTLLYEIIEPLEYYKEYI